MNNIAELINQMTLEEKAALCVGASLWTTKAFERLEVPAIYFSDGPHGVRRVPDEDYTGQKTFRATCFPTSSCLASTWNPELLYQMGEAMGEEAHALGSDVLLGPGINIKRIPLGGRNFEYFSEDPTLSGELAASLIQGIQSKGVGTTLKHFVANNQEYQRFSINVIVDERTLREIYLRGFEIAIKKAKPWSVMCAYNKVNGKYCSENPRFLVDILRNEWGYEGLIVSDWGAVHDRVNALNAGLDLEMPGPRDRRVKKVIEAIQSGKSNISTLDESIRHILEIVFKAQEAKGHETFDIERHHQLARRIASEGIVLLKNNDILPLKNQKRIAVIGHAAKTPYYQGGGSSHINPTRLDNPLEALQRLAEDKEFIYAHGYLQKGVFNQPLIDQAVKVAKSAEVALLFLALPPTKESEGYDRVDLDLTRHQVALIKAVAKVQPKLVVILNTGSPISMESWEKDAPAILQAWLMGQAGGGAVADVLLGNVNPSGKLTETFPKALEDTPAYINYPGDAGEVRYGEGIFVGYRYYDKKNLPVQYPFGFGLSYTSFEYSHPEVPDKFEDMDGITVSVDITNTGDVAGSETVQVYVHDKEAVLTRPIKELKGFTKIYLEPGETKRVSIDLDFRAFAFYHPKYHTWITESGEFEILIGASSQDIRHTLSTSMSSTLNLPCILDEESTIREWLEDPRGAAVLNPLFKIIHARFETMLEGDEGIGMDAYGVIIDMPLPIVLMFQKEMLSRPVDEIVDDLLRKVHAGNP